MAGLAITIQGIKELQDYFHTTAPEAIQKAIGDSLSDLGDEIYNRTTALCPVDTGALVQSIQVSIAANDEITATAGMDYASFVDQGTRYMEAQPFFEEPINDILMSFSSKLEEKIASELASP